MSHFDSSAKGGSWRLALTVSVLTGLFALGASGCAVTFPVGTSKRTESDIARTAIVKSSYRLFTGFGQGDLMISRPANAWRNSEPVLRFCVRPNGVPTERVGHLETRVVFTRGDHVVHHEIATAEHHCDAEAYVPLTG